MTTGFTASGLVTLTTDFGLQDPFVGLLKVQVWSRCPTARIVDLTHALPPYRPEVAAFWLERARRWCPPGTVHVAVVDPGVGTARRLLAAVADGQVFLAPDNGLLAPILEKTGGTVHAIAFDRLGAAGLDAPSATFHGRDVLAPLAAEIVAGRRSPEELGPRVADWVPSSLPPAVARADGVDGSVLLLDRYGNAFTNVAAEQLARVASPVVRVGPRQLPVVRTYGDAPAGTAVALVNSFGMLELAVVAGDAGGELDLRPGTPVRVRPGAPAT
jgi:S-adenosylmethionine hydrolase